MNATRTCSVCGRLFVGHRRRCPSCNWKRRIATLGAEHVHEIQKKSYQRNCARLKTARHARRRTEEAKAQRRTAYASMTEEQRARLSAQRKRDRVKHPTVNRRKRTEAEKLSRRAKYGECEKANGAAYRAAHPGAGAAYRFANREVLATRSRQRSWARCFGLTQAAFDILFLSQGRCCAICQTTSFGKRHPHVDHIHGTSVVRGVLCKRCNHGLGFFDDSPESLRRAAEYVERHRLRPAEVAR